MSDLQWLYLQRLAQRLYQGCLLADDGPVGQAMRRTLLALINRELQWSGSGLVFADLVVDGDTLHFRLTRQSSCSIAVSREERG